jgi:RND family efflux transporter MFP subunit
MIDKSCVAYHNRGGCDKPDANNAGKPVKGREPSTAYAGPRLRKRHDWICSEKTRVADCGPLRRGGCRCDPGCGPGGAPSAKQPPRVRTVSVELAKSEKKEIPVDVDLIGAVTPISSVALKSRLETMIVDVHFEDGARVKQGDLLFTLDARQIDAQIAQAEGNLARDRTQLAAAERDLKRYTELIGKGATTQVNLDNAKTATDNANATIQANEAILDNLKVQKSYTLIKAPISGRISAASVKIGNFVRPADTTPLATINQMAPVYVTFAIPQRVLSDLRDAMKSGQSSVAATIPGTNKTETGIVAMVENTVDAATGMATVRGKMDNESEVLWPGTLVNTTLTVRKEEAVVVPRSPCSEARPAISYSWSRRRRRYSL